MFSFILRYTKIYNNINRCSIKNYDRLEELMEMIEFDLSNTIGYYWENDTEIYCRQKGVFRTNCM